LLRLFILIHGAVLGLLIEWLRNVIGKAHILKDDTSELETLVLKHLVQELEHILGLVLALDLVDLKIGFASGY